MRLVEQLPCLLQCSCRSWPVIAAVELIDQPAVSAPANRRRDRLYLFLEQLDLCKGCSIIETAKVGLLDVHEEFSNEGCRLVGVFKVNHGWNEVVPVCDKGGKREQVS